MARAVVLAHLVAWLAGMECALFKAAAECSGLDGSLAMNRFVIAEPTLCIGCNTCMAACTLVHKAAGLQSHPRLTVMRNATHTAPVLCRQCEDAPCAQVCPVRAIQQDGDAVVLNETLCIGCKLCAMACPFGAITPSGTPYTGVAASAAGLTPRPSAFNPGEPATTAVNSTHSLHPVLAWTAGVRSVAVKCDLCATEPAGPQCVRVCPTHALVVIDDALLARANSAKRQDAASALDPNLSLFPSQEQK